MRALVISDKVEPILYSPGIVRRAGDVDLIISCGDIPFYYLEFIVSMLNRPAYFVYGNHGREVEYQSGKHGDWQTKTEPMGAENLHRVNGQRGAVAIGRSGRVDALQ